MCWAASSPDTSFSANTPTPAQVLKNLRVADKAAVRNDPAVQEALKQAAEELGDTGRILLRESGTEPVIRVMAEAPTERICEEKVDRVIAVIRERGLA